jgi:hypothetical protein
LKSLCAGFFGFDKERRRLFDLLSEEAKSSVEETSPKPQVDVNTSAVDCPTKERRSKTC